MSISSFSSANASTALSLLQSMNSSGDASSNLISIANGEGSSSGGDPVAALMLAEKNQTQDVTLQEQDPQTKAEISHFLSVVSTAPDLQTVMNDPIAQKVLLTANGLSDQVGYTALATKALMSDPSNSTNFASTLSVPAYNSMISTFNFFKNGLSVLKQPSVLQSITTEYATEIWQQQQDKTTPGLSAALDFRSRAANFTTADQILGDANVRAVITGALGIPEQIAFQPLEAQEKAITSRLDITKLQSPTFVEQIAREYLINNQSSSSSSSSSTSSSGSITNLFA